ncbi:M23 family metallopeptidase [Blastococcus sp. MG754426]|uniref:murein hydrolase activator EnvC family protein n=1 Tax=unclassified Blastococcus TaxID=2619396 RepID=UPI001EF085F9|nr:MULTISPECIES: M23 family metallopeptidase [unclassified Blastococcus]MCF6505822.1 M23 family metallopeptidase [Blastococcus sp. MG754426]MCF6511098.1 M23 family metallopeptidase [Blastococcus sp. MG754427]
MPRPLVALLLLLAVLTGVAPAAAAPVSTPAPPPEVPWSAPLPGEPVVTRPFEPPPHRYGPGHRGVDLAAAPGSPVLAAGDGVVVFAGMVAGRPVVSVEHAGGLRTTYEPVRPSVGAGRPVARGEPLGVLDPGHDGCPVAACLHWGARRGEVYLDPLSLLRLPRVRLLPLGGDDGRHPVIDR